jgi:hypothetical protein
MRSDWSLPFIWITTRVADHVLATDIRVVEKLPSSATTVPPSSNREILQRNSIYQNLCHFQKKTTSLCGTNLGKTTSGSRVPMSTTRVALVMKCLPVVPLSEHLSCLRIINVLKVVHERLFSCELSIMY